MDDKIDDTELIIHNESEEEPFNILDFPMEIIVLIFKFLNPGDVSSAALSCTRFFEASKYFKFMDNRLVILHKINFSEDQAPLTDLMETTRRIPHLMLYVVRFSDFNLFWMEYGTFVHTLTLKMCVIKKVKFLAILRYLPNLQELSLIDCNELLLKWPEEPTDHIKPRLPHLKKITLNKITIVLPHVLDYLFNMAPMLESLSIIECFRDCPDAVLRVKMVDHCILSLHKKKWWIKNLDLLGTPIDDLALTKLTAIEGLNLENFSLTFTGRISNPGILDFLRTQCNITSLDLSESLNLLDHCLFLICSKMPQLRELRLKRCLMISDFGIKEVVKLKKLQILDITGCERISDHGFQEGIVGTSWKDWKEFLTELYISSNYAFTEFTLGMTTSMFPHLTHLDISSSTNCVTDYSMQLICKYLTKLRYLNLDYCGQISDAGISGIGFNDERFISHYNYSINRLKGLRVLKMSGVYQISDVSLNNMNLVELKELTLARCQLITEDGITSISKKCPSIEILDLTECQNVNDYSMEILTSYLRRLRVLKLTCCNQITDLSCESIMENCKSLKNLYIRGCFQITYDALQNLQKLSSLKYIHSS